MLSIRNLREAPNGSETSGTTRFVANLMRPVILKDRQTVQNANFGNITSVTTTYQILPSDGLVLAGSTGSYTVTLPAVADVVKGHVVMVKKTGASGTLTIEGSASETIDGSANLATSTQNDIAALVCDGTNWQRVNLAGTAAQQSIAATAITDTATLTASQTRVILGGTNTYTLTLPSVSAAAGLTFFFKKTGASGTITLDTPSTETIDGQATFAIATQWMSVELYSDGTNWHIVQWMVVDPTP